VGVDLEGGDLGGEGLGPKNLEIKLSFSTLLISSLIICLNSCVFIVLSFYYKYELI